MLAEETADVEGVVPIGGAPAFMAAIAELPHALVTSADSALATARMGAAALPMPAVRVTAEQVGASKPDPEGFLKGAAELGFDAADCIVSEDSEAGVAAGRAAGMRVVGVGPRAAALAPDAHVADLTQVRVEAAGDGSIRLHVDEALRDADRGSPVRRRNSPHRAPGAPEPPGPRVSVPYSSPRATSSRTVATATT